MMDKKGQKFTTEVTDREVFEGVRVMSPLKAIRENCLSCNGSSYEVKLCPCTECPLWPFRFGKNPYRQKREMTDEQKEAAKKNLEYARSKRGTK